MNEILRFKNIIIAILIVGVFSFTIYQIYTHYVTVLGDLDEKAKILEEGRNTIIQWKKLKKEHEAFKNVFMSGETAEFKRLIDDAANNSEVYIQSVKITPSDKGHYWLVGIKLEATSFYKNLTDFIKLVDKRKIKINKLTISLKKKRGKTSEVSSEVKIAADLSGVVVK